MPTTPEYECVGADFKNKVLHYEMKNLVETELDLQSVVSEYSELQESVDRCQTVKISLPIVFDEAGKVDGAAIDERAKIALNFAKVTAEQELAKIQEFLAKKEEEKVAAQGDALAAELLGPNGPSMSGTDDRPAPEPEPEL